MNPLIRWSALLLFGLLVSACAHVPDRTPQEGTAWSGRLSVQIQAEPVQSFSAGFELKGRPEQGELNIFNPLGGTVARLEWSPGSATLHARGETRQFDSLDALVSTATGTPLPLAALFNWLQGHDSVAPGWQADLSRLEDGRLTALRNQPLPSVTLRIVLDK